MVHVEYFKPAHMFHLSRGARWDAYGKKGPVVGLDRDRFVGLDPRDTWKGGSYTLAKARKEDYSVMRPINQ
jgi:hypothetical protein